MRISDLQNKDVINISTGKIMGSIIDVNVSDDGKLLSFIVDHGKFFSRFTGGEVEVSWTQIKKIGDDVILVSIDNL